METTHSLHRHGFIVLLLVISVSYVSCFYSKNIINGSYHVKEIKTHSDQKRVLSSSKSGGYQPNQQPICIDKPAPSNILPIFCGEGYFISAIKFADYGQPTGDCEKNTLKRGNCGAPATLRLVKKNCLGKEECWFPVTDEMFGPTHCKGPVKFVVSGTCKKKRNLKD
ncbi:D-galactoside/L-rhamnose binding SUEL lectin domain [Arabidopsis thaliana x Arabidopsis arenosa]|uniref:D-galactoside/L-rhamnose binding SUEL lectin domain n=2 Tax=Arabidopsis TaxID=3701 RepID=A0A8T1ZX83_ARASU|nr:D-galactoside/L-rhamnose binding SUEL lectin domain [Arabidopsis thaliana x Arabidopsis arenosa]KAG7565488.1 D-galactoside/L-rhamnose binding SUEL lectin domain [Arabidopsis suecica]